MFELPITKESKEFLCLIYEEYLIRRRTMSKDLSVKFSEYPEIVLKYINESDCHSCVEELKNIGYFKTDVLGRFFLTDKAITFMENRFKKGISELAEFLNLIKL